MTAETVKSLAVGLALGAAVYAIPPIGMILLIPTLIALCWWVHKQRATSPNPDRPIGSVLAKFIREERLESATDRLCAK